MRLQRLIVCGAMVALSSMTFSHHATAGRYKKVTSQRLALHAPLAKDRAFSPIRRDAKDLSSKRLLLKEAQKILSISPAIKHLRFKRLGSNHLYAELVLKKNWEMHAPRIARLFARRSGIYTRIYENTWHKLSSSFESRPWSYWQKVLDNAEDAYTESDYAPYAGEIIFSTESKR